MNKDLYIEFLESEIRRIRAGANQLYEIVSDCPCPDRDKCDSCGRTQEVQDLKLENDRLAKRDDKMRQVIRAIACDPDCEFCLLRGSDCSDSAMRLLAMTTLDELEEL